MASTQEPKSEEKPKPEEKPHPLSQAEITAKLEEFWRLFYELVSKPDSANEAEGHEKGNEKAGRFHTGQHQ
jgi:hypothetical protein